MVNQWVWDFVGQIKRTSVSGSRDYALCLGYMLFGLRPSAWRLVRRCDYGCTNGKYWVISDGGQHQVDGWAYTMVTNAVDDYLRISGRHNMDATEYIFLGADSTKPLSDRRVRYIIERYARMAGISVQPDDLRDAAAMVFYPNGRIRPEYKQLFI